jgi:hypothetical protein
MYKFLSFQAFKKLSHGFVKLADESESFESKTILGHLRGAPDLLPNIKNVKSMFVEGTGECKQSMYQTFSDFQ